MAAAVGALLPEGAIVSDEAQTSGLFNPGATAGGPRHSWLCLTGRRIGPGPARWRPARRWPPGSPGPGPAGRRQRLYTIQSLWTQAREGLDVTTVIYNNRSYSMLNMELGRVGADGGGPKAQSMLDLHRPDIDFVAVARGLGVPATRAETAEAFTEPARGRPGRARPEPDRRHRPPDHLAIAGTGGDVRPWPARSPHIRVGLGLVEVEPLVEVGDLGGGEDVEDRMRVLDDPERTRRARAG